MLTWSFPCILLPMGKESILLCVLELSTHPGSQHPPGKGHLLPWQKSCHVTKILLKCHKPCGAMSPGGVGTSSKLWQVSSLCPHTVTVRRARLCSRCRPTWGKGPIPRTESPTSDQAEPAVPVAVAAAMPVPVAVQSPCSRSRTVQPTAGLQEQCLMPPLPAPKCQMSPGQIYFQILTQSQHWICNHRLQF